MVIKKIIFFNIFCWASLNSLGIDTFLSAINFQKSPPSHVVGKDSRDKFLADYYAFIKEQESTTYKQDLEKITVSIQECQGRLNKNNSPHQKELTNKMLYLLNQSFQVVVDTDSVRQQVRGVYEEIKNIYEGLASDPHFNKFKVEEKASYNYEELTLLNQKLIDVKNRHTEAKVQSQKLQADIDRYTKSIEQLQGEIKEKLKQQKNYSQQAQESSLEGAIIDAQGKLLIQRKELAQWKLKEAEIRLALVHVQMNASKGQIEILEREYVRVKRATVIPLKYVKKAENALEEKKIKSLAERDRLFQEKLAYILHLQGTIKRDIDNAIIQYNLSASDLEALRDWNFQPKTYSQWLILTTLDPLLAHDSLTESSKELIKAMIAHLKAEYKREDIEVLILQSWYKFMSRKFRAETERDIDESIKDYDLVKNELIAQLRTTSDSRDAAINSLQRFNKSLESVKSLIDSIKDQRRTLFKDNERVFLDSQKALKETEEYIRQKIDITSRLIEKYQATVTVIDDSIKRVSSMLSELTTKGFWKRSDQSIEWVQIKNIIPDLQRFVHGVCITGIEYLTVAHISQIGKGMIEYLKDPLYLLMFLINSILICIIYMLLRLFLPDLYQFLYAGTSGIGFIIYLRLWAALTIKFVMMYMNTLFVWGFMYLLLSSHIIQDSYVCLLIELCSIPYLLYIAYQFMRFIVSENHYHNYSIINKTYEHRFHLVGSIILYSLIILYFLRGAILLDYTLTSDLPTILLALMFIVIQLGAIFLIFEKKQFLAIIPHNTPLWQWIYEHVEKYYYGFFIAVVAVIIMSNPYVGYGRQVIYIVSRFFLTLFIIPLFLWIHSRIKRISSNLFFYYEEGESMRERFSSGRLWYGIFIIVSFVFFIIGLVFVVGSIWGYGLGFNDIIDFLNRELTAVKDETGREISVTLFSLMQIVLFVLGGIFLNYIINQFVLKRVFDPFLVGVGVQNTISAFTKYAIILLAVFIGLSNAGLEGLTTKFAIIIGGLSFALQEPLRDFFSYFIILVQRPVKIGDLIQINDDIIGVVRHITPRSVILRRKNSVTVIVPNSHIILHSVINWNYSRSYFAFNDIMLTVAYTKDPQRVKDILLTVLHDNYMILKSPAPIVWLSDFVDNGYQFLVRGYLTADKVLEQWEISSHIRLELVRKLRENGIEVASPTRMVRVTTESETPQPPLASLM